MNIQEIDAAFVADQVNAWLSLHPDVAANPEARGYIQQFSKIHYNQAGTVPSAELFDQGLVAYLNAKKLATERQRLGEQLVRWFEKPTVSYFVQSDKNWGRARAWLGAQTQAILTLENWVDFVKKEEYTPGFFDWSIEPDALVKIVRNAVPPYLQFEKVDGHLWPTKGLLIDKFGKLAVEQAYQQLSVGINKKATELREPMDTWKVTAKDREAAAAKEAQERAAKESAPANIARWKTIAENIVSGYSCANYSERNSIRAEMEAIRVHVGDEIDWQATAKARQEFLDGLEKRNSIREKQAYYRRMGLNQ